MPQSRPDGGLTPRRPRRRPASAPLVLTAAGRAGYNPKTGRVTPPRPKRDPVFSRAVRPTGGPAFTTPSRSKKREKRPGLVSSITKALTHNPVTGPATTAVGALGRAVGVNPTVEQQVKAPYRLKYAIGGAELAILKGHPERAIGEGLKGLSGKTRHGVADNLSEVGVPHRIAKNVGPAGDAIGDPLNYLGAGVGLPERFAWRQAESRAYGRAAKAATEKAPRALKKLPRTLPAGQPSAARTVKMRVTARTSNELNRQAAERKRAGHTDKRYVATGPTPSQAEVDQLAAAAKGDGPAAKAARSELAALRVARLVRLGSN